MPDDRYPIVDPDPETLDYFKKNPGVAGMAVGAGLNGYGGPRRVMVNPYSQLNKTQRDALVQNERLRHYMDEKKPELAFEPTAEQLASFRGTEYGKPENIGRLKETLVARILTGDQSAGKVTPEQERAAERLFSEYQKAGSPFAPQNILKRNTGNPLASGRKRVFPTEHPYKKNPDGSESNVILGGYNIRGNAPGVMGGREVAGKERVIPNMVNGILMTPGVAVSVAKAHGIDNYPTFDSIEESNAWAEANHGKIDQHGYLNPDKLPDFSEVAQKILARGSTGAMLRRR